MDVFSLQNLVEALDEFEDRYLECYRQVAATPATAPAAGLLLLPLLAPTLPIRKAPRRRLTRLNSAPAVAPKLCRRKTPGATYVGNPFYKAPQRRKNNCDDDCKCDEPQDDLEEDRLDLNLGFQMPVPGHRGALIWTA